MSDISEYSAAAGANSAAAATSAMLNTTGNLTASTFNYKNTKRLAKFQNEMNIENWERQNKYNEKLAANYHSQILQSARNAGLNPAAALGGPNFAQQVGAIPSPSLTNSGSTASSPDFSFLSQLPFMKSQVAMNNATIDKMKAETEVADAVADKTRAETTGIGLENQFNSETIRSRINLTNEQNEMLTKIAETINNNPELLNAYANEKKAIVDNLKSQSELNASNIDLNTAKIGTEKTIQLLNGEKVKSEQVNRYVMRTQGALNETQKQILLDDNFRKNYSSLPYLFSTAQKVLKSDMSNEEKASAMVLLKACMDDVSNVSKDARKAYYQDIVFGNMQSRGYANSSKLQWQQTLSSIIVNYATIPASMLKSVFGGASMSTMSDSVESVLKTTAAWTKLLGPDN